MSASTSCGSTGGRPGTFARRTLADGPILSSSRVATDDDELLPGPPLEDDGATLLPAAATAEAASSSPVALVAAIDRSSSSAPTELPASVVRRERSELETETEADGPSSSEPEGVSDGGAGGAEVEAAEADDALILADDGAGEDKGGVMGVEKVGRGVVKVCAEGSGRWQKGKSAPWAVEARLPGSSSSRQLS